MPENTVVLAADHAGYELKNTLKVVIEERGLKVLDLGAHNGDSIDYPDMAAALAKALADGRAYRGVLVCGTGIGISIAANRHLHIRAALCHDVTTARLARQHNDANVLAMGSRVLGPSVARDCLEAFLDTPFEGGRHQRRVDKLSGAATSPDSNR
ncbi:ribose 5-phosphate isomerase B [Benzoatithermus flavus]|uniref:Ribose 5-phosphate isomerase B n=1 Tax=Benzoatithermus flavus TaxID=3108223 RepID=A0ABU8XNA7_9PROT